MWYLVSRKDGRVQVVGELQRGGRDEIVQIGKQFDCKEEDYAKTWVICRAENSEEAWNTALERTEMWSVTN